MMRTLLPILALAACANGAEPVSVTVGDLSDCSVYDATAEITAGAVVLTFSLPTPAHAITAGIEGQTVALTVTPPDGMAVQMISERTITVPLPEGTSGPLTVRCAG